MTAGPSHSANSSDGRRRNESRLAPAISMAVRRVKDTSFSAAVCTALTQAIPTTSGGWFKASATKERTRSPDAAEPLEEIPGRAKFAATNVPALFRGLLVRSPAGIAAAERECGHAQGQHIDTAVSLTRRRVARHRRTACLVGIPRPALRRRSCLQCSDDAVGHLLEVETVDAASTIRLMIALLAM
jgi:hypothetical protein